jgi:hypothetical protein
MIKINLISRHPVPYTLPKPNDDRLPPRAWDRPEPKKVPQGRKPSERYDAMGMMISRIRSQSTAIPESNNAKQANFPNDDVFIQPQGSFSTSRNAQNIGSKSQSSRTSVIRRMENVESQNLY